MKALRQSLELGLISPVYIFYGPERYLMEQLLARLTELVAPGEQPWNRELLRGDEHELAEILESAQSPGFFGDKKLIVVPDAPWLKPRRKKGEGAAEDDSAAEKKQLEQLIAYVQDPNPDTVLVLLTDGNINRGSRLVKAVTAHGRVVEFSSPKGAEREQWLAAYLRSAGLQAEPGLCSYMSLMCGEGLSTLKMEADKLILFCQGQRMAQLADAEAIVSRGSLAGVFELTDQVAAKNAAAAVSTLRRLLIQGEAPQALTGMLAHQYRTTLAVKDMLQRGFRTPEIASKLGVNPYFVQKCAALSRSLDYRQLLRVLDVLLLADLEGKNGQGEAAERLELAILKICAL